MPKHNPMQMEMLQKEMGQKIMFNQMQFSIAHTPVAKSGPSVNNHFKELVGRDGSTLQYCRWKGIDIQAWPPFQCGYF